MLRTTLREVKESDSKHMVLIKGEHEEGSSVAGGTGCASARRGYNGMRAGFRPDQAGREEEGRGQRAACPARSEAEARGQRSRSEEEGASRHGRPEEEGRRPPEGSAGWQEGPEEEDG